MDNLTFDLNQVADNGRTHNLFKLAESASPHVSAALRKMPCFVSFYLRERPFLPHKDFYPKFVATDLVEGTVTTEEEHSLPIVVAALFMMIDEYNNGPLETVLERYFVREYRLLLKS